LSENPQKVNGLAGITLGAIIQSVATVIVAFALGLAFLWKVGLIAIACTPPLISSGYIRLVRSLPEVQSSDANGCISTESRRDEGPSQ